MRIVDGIYTGNGSAQAVTVGFAPAVVFIKGGANISVWRTSTMASDAGKWSTTAAAVATGLVTAMDATSFTVGSDAKVNANGTAYYWFALEAVGADTAVGTYTGTGSAHDVAAGLSFNPDIVIVLGEGARNAYIKTNTMASNNSKSFSGNLDTTGITAFGTGTFSVGTSANTNTNGETFHYIALKQVAGYLKTTTHVGSGVAQDVTGLGLTPRTIFIVQGATVTVVYRGGEQTGDAAFQVDNTTTGTTRITATASGQFTVGTSSVTNNATGTPTYHDIAFAEGNSDDPAGASRPPSALALLGVL